ncbi:MAG TPA: hypothetical protein VN682_15520 [Terriglobales bacterium]|nr:hypothetical protein [Terriglobales bacterium]
MARAEMGFSNGHPLASIALRRDGITRFAALAQRWQQMKVGSVQQIVQPAHRLVR